MISSWKISSTGSSAIAAATELTSDEHARPSETAASPISAPATISSRRGFPRTTALEGPPWFAVDTSMYTAAWKNTINPSTLTFERT